MLHLYSLYRITVAQNISIGTNTAQKDLFFLLKISSLNVTKSAVSCKFGYIYGRNLQWKSSLFVLSNGTGEESSRKALLTKPMPPKLFNMSKVSLHTIQCCDVIVQYKFLIWESYFVAAWKLKIQKFSQLYWDDLLRIFQASHLV